jgi:hypothetical protein
MRLTNALLKKMIREEAAKFGDMESTEDRAKDADEVEADEFAGSLEKKIDYIKALKIEENRLRRRLRKLAEVKARVLRSV